VGPARQPRGPHYCDSARDGECPFVASVGPNPRLPLSSPMAPKQRGVDVSDALIAWSLRVSGNRGDVGCVGAVLVRTSAVTVAAV
jgi:hypothetical protein